MIIVTVELEDFDAECMCACAIVGAEGCPDKSISDAAYVAIEKIRKAIEDAR